jgi:hypothetical protein
MNSLLRRCGDGWRPKTDVGASSVEFALLFPIFMVLALGTIAGGTAFSKQINITQSAREVSRYGATYDITGPSVGIDNWLTAVGNAVKESAGPKDSPLGGYDYYCVAYVSTTATGDVDSAKSKYKDSDGSTGSGACPGQTRKAVIASTDYVQVAIARKTSFFMLFVNPTIQLDSLSFTPYEGTAP